jgi:hypothetical protein
MTWHQVSSATDDVRDNLRSCSSKEYQPRQNNVDGNRRNWAGRSDTNDKLSESDKEPGNRPGFRKMNE